MRLLLLEDDPILGEGLRDWLRAEGHAVDWCRSIAEARAAVHGEPFDAWLLDWQLPDGSGKQWLVDRQRAGPTPPALLLTARGELSDRIEGLDAGAADYLVKPFAPEELAARLRACLRRQQPARKRLEPDVELDLAARRAWAAGEEADLTAREWALLEALALRTGRWVSKADLDRLVHGFDGEPALSNALEVHIAKLRRKLGRDAIETLRGMGYRVRDAQV
ncbi:response regulator transcription factor [Inhella sp.]|uniref:response regulator transcription factor n=1 Tax=Inhella sp. TaxID=1921806 RepID=UPI0035AE3A4E